MTLDTLLARQFVLPSIPRVVALLLSELDQPRPDLRRVNQLISTDPALTVRLLRWANTDFFRLAGQVSSVPEALAILSLGQVRAMGAEAAASASLRAVPGIALPPFWTYSLDVAKLARSLAGVVRQNQQAAFTCGLIHGVGELAMHMGMPEAVLMPAPVSTTAPPCDAPSFNCLAKACTPGSRNIKRCSTLKKANTVQIPKNIGAISEGTEDKPFKWGQANSKPKVTKPASAAMG